MYIICTACMLDKYRTDTISRSTSHGTDLEQCGTFPDPDCSAWSQECCVLGHCPMSSTGVATIAAVVTQLAASDDDVTAVVMVTSSPAVAHCLCRQRRLDGGGFNDGGLPTWFSEGRRGETTVAEVTMSPDVVAMATVAGDMCAPAEVELFVTDPSQFFDTGMAPSTTHPAPLTSLCLPSPLPPSQFTSPPHGGSTCATLESFTATCWHTRADTVETTVAWVAPPSDWEVAPPSDWEVAPPSDWEVAPPSDCEVAPPSDCEVAPPSDWEVAPPSDCEVVPSSDCEVCRSECCCSCERQAKVSPHLPQRYGRSYKHNQQVSALLLEPFKHRSSHVITVTTIASPLGSCY